MFSLYSCNNNSTGPTNNSNSNLLFSQDSLVCDYHDSVYVDTSNFYFQDSLTYHITSWNYSKIKITFNFETNDTLRSGFDIFMHHSYYYMQPDTGFGKLFGDINPSDTFLFYINYPSSYDFYLTIYLFIYTNIHFYPLHTSYARLSNINIYKVY